MVLALIFVAGILALVELSKSKGQSVIAWGLLALSVALQLERLPRSW